MNLITKQVRDKLLKNFKANLRLLKENNLTVDFIPVLRLFFAPLNVSWYISEWDGEDQLFGVSDFGDAELSHFSIKQLVAVSGPFGEKVEQDKLFSTNKSLSEIILLLSE